MLYTISLLKSSFTLLITGESESESKLIIFSAGFYLSPIETWWPLPFFAHPSSSSSEQPFPIPIVWILEYLLFAPTILITPSVSETPPSVSKNICLAYPYCCLAVRSFSRVVKIYVPPRSAFIFPTLLTAYLMYLSLYCLLLSNIV